MTASPAATENIGGPVAVLNLVRHNVYRDSVTLMRLSARLESLRGVRRAAVMMGTPQNLALLGQAGLLDAEGARASTADVVIALLAEDAAALAAARALAEAAIDAREAPAAAQGRTHRVRSLDTACRALTGANLAIVSVPGAWAGAEAMRALRAGLHVMVFSDHVPVETEVELKRYGARRGLLVMGPDCGTAILHGVPLGFANAVPRGRIGLAGASGTGLQEVACLVAAAGEGVSHAIGLGGRDLSDEVGGLTLEPALAALGADPSTSVVCLVGKRPGVAVAERLRTILARLGKPCVVHFPDGMPSSGAAHLARTLEDAAEAAVALARGARPAAIEFTLPAPEIERLVARAAGAAAGGQRFVRGLYAGGTLALEARALLAARLLSVAPGLTGDGDGHRVVDLGDDAFTLGRPHPMIDGRLRRERILTEAGDPATAVLLLDVVLGFGAHEDPAGDLAPALTQAMRDAEAAGRHLTVIASVCGTDADPQPRSLQVATLRAAGAIVMPSNAQAARLAALIAARLAR